VLALLICKGLTRLFLSPRWAASGSGDYGGLWSNNWWWDCGSSPRREKDWAILYFSNPL